MGGLFPTCAPGTEENEVGSEGGMKLSHRKKKMEIRGGEKMLSRSPKVIQLLVLLFCVTQ